MVSTNTLQRVSTNLLLSSVAIYLLLVNLDVTQANVEYSIEKPTLLGRTPPIIPGERFFFKRESKTADDEEDTPSTTQAPDESRSGLTKEEDAKKSESNDTDTSKQGTETNDKEGADQESDKSETSDDKKEVDKSDEQKAEEEEASEGSRHFKFGFNLFGGHKKRKTTKRPVGVESPFPKLPMQPSQPMPVPVKPAPPPPPNIKTTTTTSTTTKKPPPKPISTTKEPPKPVPQPPVSRPPPTPKPTVSPTAKPTNPPSPVPPVQPSSTKAPQIPTTTPKPANQTTTVSPVKPVTTRVPQPSNSATTAIPSIGPTTAIPSRPNATTTTSLLGNSTNPQVNNTKLNPIVANSTFRVPPTNSTSDDKQNGTVAATTPLPKANTTPPGVTTKSHLQSIDEWWRPMFPNRPPERTLAPVTITSKPIIVLDRAGPPNGSTTQRPRKPHFRPEFYTTSPPPSTTDASTLEPTKGSTVQPSSTSSKPDQGVTTTTTASPTPAGSTTQVPTSTSKPTTNNPISTSVKPTSSSPVAPSSTSSAKPTTSTTAKPMPTGSPQMTTTNLPIASTGAPQTTSVPPQVKPTTTAAPSANSTTTGPPTIYAHVASMNAKPPEFKIINGSTYVVQTNPIPIVVNPNITRQMVNPDAELFLQFNRTIFDPRDITYFLESHPAHSVHDPRVYFTSERTTRSLVIMFRELARIPEQLRLAYMVRVFNELGRKIASKLNYYSVELVAILKKEPDDLGNKPEVSHLVDAVNNAFESKDDGEIQGQAEIDLEYDNYMNTLIDKNPEKRQVFRAAMTEISSRFAQLISYFVLKATTASSSSSSSRGGDSKPLITIPAKGQKKLPVLLGESLKSGARVFVLETAYDDRFRIPLDAVGYTNMILNDTISMMTKRIESKDMNVSKSIKRDFDDPLSGNSFKDLNAISDEIGLIGSWNSFLFSNLGSAERVIKIFGSLLARVPPEAKPRWINMYLAQIHTELERTISGFVTMQGMPWHGNESQQFLLDAAKTIEIIPNKVPTIRDNYLADKNRIPARCYLAGRRWRLVLSRGLDKFIDQDLVIEAMANRVGSIKNRMIEENGNDIYRLCLPRLEVGIRGWSIDGHPLGDNTGEVSDKFPLKNPIEGLTEMRDPFASGVTLGFGIGVRVGYNEERNATLEIEQSRQLRTSSNEFNRSLNINEVNYVAMVSYRRAATVGARKALEIAVREGYLSALKVSIRAGMNIPMETGSRISALKSASFAGLAGQEAGKSAAEAFVMGLDHLRQEVKKSLVKVGQNFGLLAGQIAGEFIGSIVGKAAAEEAYRRSIIRGGKVARAKFHLEEYEAGAMLGFDYGVKEGKRIASSSTLDPSAPSVLRLRKPVFSDKDEADHEVDHWEKELIPPLTDSIIADLASVRDHTPVRGSLRGTYKVAKEVKKGLERVSYTNVTYDLEVFAEGFIKNSIAYLTLNGTVNKMGILRGSLIARDIFNDDQL